MLKRWAAVCVLAAMCFLGVDNLRAEVEHVIHISVDGLRGDFIKTRIETNPTLYPNFKRFVDEGATTFNARTDYTHTNTLPNHTSMVTGRPVSQPSGKPNTTQHGYTFNGEPSVGDTLHNDGNPNLSYVSSTFDIAHDNGLKTAMYATKSKFAIYNQSYTAATGAVDVTGVDNGRDKIDTFVADSNGHNMFSANMAANDFNYAFLHYSHPDDAGHSIGWGTPAWDTAVQTVDTHLGVLMNIIQSDPEMANNTVIVLTADHGGSGTAHSTASSATNYTIPVMVWGHGVSPGTDLYQLNPTTRTNPGTGRPDYNAVGQPIRNGDTGNLALDLLGLGPITGSMINVAQNLVVTSPFKADFNGDLEVDMDDLTIWQNQYGKTTTAPALRGDADGDRDVDGRDFLLWQRQLGSSALVAEIQALTVPEPSTLLSMLAAAMVLGWRNNRRD